MSMKGLFAFSQEAADRLLDKFREKPKTQLNQVKLDSGEIVDYTECRLFDSMFESNESVRENWFREYKERNSDGIFLGEGQIYSINGIKQTLEREE